MYGLVDRPNLGYIFQGDEDTVREELQDKILELLQKRAESSTICPSEARELASPRSHFLNFYIKSIFLILWG